MKRRWIRWLIALFFTVALCGGCGLALWYYEPIYLEAEIGGKSEREWAKLLSSSNVEERREAAAMLGSMFYKFGLSRWTVLALINALDDEDAIVRMRVIYALRTIASQLGPDVAHAETVVPKLIHLLQDEDPGVRHAAILTLPRMGETTSQALDPLTDLYDHKDELTRVYAAQSWCHITAQVGGTVPVLQAASQSKDLTVRMAAIEALAVVGIMTKSKTVVPVLLPLLDDPESKVRSAAVSAIPSAGPAAIEAVPKLIHTLEGDSSPIVRKVAVEALGRIAPEKDDVVNALLKGFHEDSDPDVRFTAANIMGNRSNKIPSYADALIEALETEQDDETRARLAGCFAYVKDPPAKIYPILVKMLDDKYFGARQAAADVLGTMGKPEAIPHLIRLLGDENRNVRWSAILSLQEFGRQAEAAVPHLERLRDSDPDENVREIAKRALKRIRLGG
jgi:HEAT repeat protein